VSEVSVGLVLAGSVKALVIVRRPEFVLGVSDSKQGFEASYIEIVIALVEGYCVVGHRKGTLVGTMELVLTREEVAFVVEYVVVSYFQYSFRTRQHSCQVS
jgi:hypothetical protein